MNQPNSKVKTIIIIYEDGSKQFFNYYKSYKEEEKKSKKYVNVENDGEGLEEVEEINEYNPSTYEELKRVYEKIYKK